MTISGQILADSVNGEGKRITTFLLYYPRFILPQLTKHRCFSINTASSRAIPIKKLCEQVMEDKVYPSEYGKNKSGMVAKDSLDPNAEAKAIAIIDQLREDAVDSALRLSDLGLHKQVANRYIEPFMHVSSILTGTEFENFFRLRIHEHAQPEIRELAESMQFMMKNSAPAPLPPDGWHLPLVTEEDKENHNLNTQLAMSVARCARVSYNNHLNRDKTPGEEIDLFKKLVSSKHWSPVEHQAMASSSLARSGNFTGGWTQHRQLLDLMNNDRY